MLTKPGAKEAHEEAKKAKEEAEEGKMPEGGKEEKVKAITRLLRSFDHVKMCVACFNTWELDGGQGFTCPDEPGLELHRACRQMADEAWVGVVMQECHTGEQLLPYDMNFLV